MTEEELQDALKRIGKGCFVQLYGAFADLSIPNGAIVPSVLEYVKNNGRKNPSPKAANTRISKARKVIKSGMGRSALMICSQSDIPEEFQLKATRQLDK